MKWAVGEQTLACRPSPPLHLAWKSVRKDESCKSSLRYEQGQGRIKFPWSRDLSGISRLCCLSPLHSLTQRKHRPFCCNPLPLTTEGPCWRSRFKSHSHPGLGTVSSGLFVGDREGRMVAVPRWLEGMLHVRRVERLQGSYFALGYFALGHFSLHFHLMFCRDSLSSSPSLYFVLTGQSLTPCIPLPSRLFLKKLTVSIPAHAS